MYNNEFIFLKHAIISKRGNFENLVFREGANKAFRLSLVEAHIKYMYFYPLILLANFTSLPYLLNQKVIFLFLN